MANTATSAIAIEAATVAVMQAGMHSDPVWTPSIAGSYLNLAPSTLAKLRMRPGAGPKFIRLSGRKVGYRRSALDEWLAARVRSSTLDDKRGEARAA